ncbi:hypothetical protein RB195_019803 [Necator americanus]|uniref:G-protein coupled receptors family 1 profile domain-containing protein n=1 Tax=Necator americanus TaxID=51031 RepID=A0ABR1CHG2_NECAM
MDIDEELKIRFMLYIAVGILVCISSVICIFVFSSKDFRQKYIMYIALSVGDLPPTNDELRRQRMMLAMTGFYVILVSIPNIVLIANEWATTQLDALVVGIFYCLYGFQSFLSLFIYIVFRPDFRLRLLSMIRRPKSPSNFSAPFHNTTRINSVL